MAPTNQTVSLRATSYIDLMLKRYLDKPLEQYPGAWGYTPADDTLVREYEAAVAARATPSDELRKKYMSLFGSLLHATKYRPEISASLGRLDRAQLAVVSKALATNATLTSLSLAGNGLGPEGTASVVGAMLAASHTSRLQPSGAVCSHAESDWSNLWKSRFR